MEASTASTDTEASHRSAPGHGGGKDFSGGMGGLGITHHKPNTHKPTPFVKVGNTGKESSFAHRHPVMEAAKTSAEVAKAEVAKMLEMVDEEGDGGLREAKTKDAQRNAMHDSKLYEVDKIHRAAFKWTGTVWSGIARNFLFWLPIVVWLGCKLAMTKGGWQPETTDAANALSSLSTFVAFYACFFGNQCYQRWWSMYCECMTVQGRMVNITLLLRASLGKGNETAVLIVRHLQLAHLLGFVGLSDEYDEAFYVNLADRYAPFIAPRMTLTCCQQPGIRFTRRRRGTRSSSSGLQPMEQCRSAK
jgi:hypothetical protein